VVEPFVAELLEPELTEEPEPELLELELLLEAELPVA
jgi:hypothetical protein